MLATLLALPAAANALDLVPVSLTRIEGGGASPPTTPVRVQVEVMNASGSDMPATLAVSGWTVQIQGYSLNPYVVRRALRAGERYGFAVTVIVPCGKLTELEIHVNASRGIHESDFDNNRAAFAIAGNACPVAARTPVSPR
jgi:hypothetical protein